MDRSAKGGADASKRRGRGTGRAETREKLEGDGEEDAGTSSDLRTTEDIRWGERGSMVTVKREGVIDGKASLNALRTEGGSRSSESSLIEGT